MSKVSFSLFEKNIKLIRQSEQAECGLACLAMVADFYGYKAGLREMREKFGMSMKGATARQILSSSQMLNIGGRALRCDPEAIKNIRLPAILHWEMNHFVVLEKVTSSGYHIIDPAIGKRKIKAAEFNKKFTGILIELVPNKSFEKSKESIKLKLIDLFPFTYSFWKSLIKIVTLSIFLQIFILISPKYIQYVIDEAILKSNIHLLVSIAIGFALIKVLEVATSLIRALLLQYMSVILSFDLANSIIRHLFKLPIEYFEKRQVGDIQQRFNSVHVIRELILSGVAGSIIDGLLAISLGIMLFYYNAQLATIVVLVVAIYSLIRIALLNLSRRLTMDSVVAQANTQSYFLESIRAIKTIKMSGLEHKRENDWKNKSAEALNSDVRLGNTEIIFGSSSEILLGLSNILIVYLAAKHTINGDFTVGMIMSFLVYKVMFEARIMSFIDFYIKMKLLDVQLKRLSDIVLNGPEVTKDFGIKEHVLQGSVNIDSVSFKYSKFEANILNNINIDIVPGEYIVLVGKSGSGKTTLLKLLMGIIKPTSGTICFDSVSVSDMDINIFRKQLGVLMQDDRLLEGTILDNISLFDDCNNMEEVQNAAKLASIDKQIEEMPMKYYSLVGEMGSSLSGGQAQRVMLARAVYKKPKILILDEGTSQLDVETEKKINKTLKALNITRIAAAHRPETIASADRVFEIKHGEARELSKQQLDNFLRETRA